MEVDSELNAFKAGGVGMIWNGIWQTTNVTGDSVMFESGATAFPQIGEQPAVWAGSHQLALPVKAEADACRDTAAAIFIQYLLDNSLEWSKAGQIPANNTVRASAEFGALEPQASIAPSADYAIFPPSVPGITDAFAALGEAVGSIMAGTATDVQATLDASVERAQRTPSAKPRYLSRRALSSWSKAGGVSLSRQFRQKGAPDGDGFTQACGSGREPRPQV